MKEKNDARVRKGKLRPRTAPETQTLSKLGAERRTVYKRKKVLKVFRKKGKMEIYRCSQAASMLMKKTRPKTVGSVHSKLIPKRVQSPSVNEVFTYPTNFNQNTSNFAELDGSSIDRGKLFPVHLALNSYIFSDEKDECLGYHRSHVVGKPVSTLDPTYWDATDATLKILSRMVPTCSKFVSSGCHSLTDDGFCDLFSLNKCLKYIDISGCFMVTDDSMCVMAKNNTKLQYLNISCCTKITDDTLGSISEHLLYIETLYVADCPLLTNHGIIKLSEGQCCNTLKDVDVSSCPLLSDDGLRELVNKSPSLSQLKCFSNELIDGTMFSVPIPGQNMECNLIYLMSS